LLDALNKAEGEILENDALIQTLESLKRESA
jgi:dynein heavy chain 1